MPTLPHYRVRLGPPLEWRVWGDESVLFDPSSGDTHLIDVAVREALLCLSERACDCAALTVAVAQRLDMPADDALQSYVARLLERLDDLGLVEPIDA